MCVPMRWNQNVKSYINYIHGFIRQGILEDELNTEHKHQHFVIMLLCKFKKCTRYTLRIIRPMLSRDYKSLTL